MLYCYLGPGMLAVLERWLPYTVTILDRFHCTIMVYGLTPYIREYFTREYFNTTVPSNREFKNAKNAKIANPRNINPAKIKAHTVLAISVDIQLTHDHIHFCVSANSCLYYIETCSL